MEQTLNEQKEKITLIENIPVYSYDDLDMLFISNFTTIQTKIKWISGSL